MPTDSQRIIEFLKQVIAGLRPEDLARLQPRHDPAPPKVPGGSAINAAAIDDRWRLPGLSLQTRAGLADARVELADARAELADARTIEQSERFAHNIENFIG